MGYVKSMLPEDWEPEQSYSPPKKYLCIGNEEVEAKWLQRWYDVPFEECQFHHEDPRDFIVRGYLPSSFEDWPGIVLRPLPKGADYKQKLKALKTERLLHGNDIR